jgi:ABC-2 type transport system permease protein
MSLRRILAVMRKEVTQVWRDPRSLLVIFAMPIVQLVIFGYGVNLDIKHIPLCVYDRDTTQSSQDLLKHFQATDYFRIAYVADNYRDITYWIDRGACSMAVVVPPQFSEHLHSQGQAQVQALLDASDNNTANISMGYALSIVQDYSRQVQVDWQVAAAAKGMSALTPNVTFQPRTWFNEDLESMSNIVPGVVAMVMAVVGAFLTSLTIAREWERGTMEQLIATPVRKLEIQVGKLVPYFIIGITDTALCAGVAVWWFRVPFRGSWIVLFACSALFLIVVLSLGYFFSVTAKSQLGASQLALLVTLLPTFLLSGFIFPIDQMPVVVQWITRILPARYYVFILRNVFLKGTPVQLMAGQVAALAIIAGVLILLATRAFQKRLE